MLFMIPEAIALGPTCNLSNLNCKKEGEACGYERESGTQAFCREGLVCQSDTYVPASEFEASYVGTCKSDCDTNHAQNSAGICAPACQIEDSTVGADQWMTIADQQTVMMDMCGNQCKCEAETNTFTCPRNTPCVPTQPVCENTENWQDSEGNDCTWYESSALNCAAFADKRADSNGRTALQACCACGGGKAEITDQEGNDIKVQRMRVNWELH